MMDRANKWDILLADVVHGMTQRPYGTYDEETWQTIKELSQAVSKEAGMLP